MRLSQYFLPTLKETPAEAKIASHRLMLRAGLVNQTLSGIYSWLPIGVRVLNKIEKIVAEEQDRIGCHRVITPTLQPADLWRESGRYEDYGQEMLCIQDRHERDMLYGPTAEEVMTDIFRQYVHSYKEVPLLLYQIQWKFRDEIRPRFGVMRGREFLMKDAYSFDLSVEEGEKSYEKMFTAYLRTFDRLGLKAIPVKADTGPIGGDMSHEFQIVAETGESQLYYDAAFEELSDEERTPQNIRKLYAMADEMHVPDECPIPADRLKTARGIEVGHIFFFGSKYSEPMGAKVMGPDSNFIHMQMGSYGVGVSRLVGAIIEASHDDSGIIWPEAVAPFKVGLLSLKAGDAEADKLADDFYQKLQAAGVEVLLDDRKERAGAKFANMDLIGLPWQVIIGQKTLKEGLVEVKCRKTGEREDLSIESAFAKLTG